MLILSLLSTVNSLDSGSTCIRQRLSDDDDDVKCVQFAESHIVHCMAAGVECKPTLASECVNE